MKMISFIVFKRSNFIRKSGKTLDLPNVMLIFSSAPESERYPGTFLDHKS